MEAKIHSTDAFTGLHLENLPRGGRKYVFKLFGGGAMHLATLMHSNHAICIVGVSRGSETCQSPVSGHHMSGWSLNTGGL